VVAAWLAVWSGVAAKPDAYSWRQLCGAGALGGIGFTMSLFIATLAFAGTTLLDSAKVGILGGSILSGVIGALVVRRGSRSA
jgi:NhaA family Na+:H+ antiporter